MEDGRRRVFGFQWSVFRCSRLREIGAEWRGLAAFLWSDLDGPTVREGLAPNGEENRRDAKSAEVAEEFWVDRGKGRCGWMIRSRKKRHCSRAVAHRQCHPPVGGKSAGAWRNLFNGKVFEVICSEWPPGRDCATLRAGLTDSDIRIGLGPHE